MGELRQRHGKTQRAEAASTDIDNGIGGAGQELKKRAPPMSVLKARTPMDFMARLFFVGIFVIENGLHAWFFDAEIETLVAPALRPLPRELAVCLHVVHIIFGMCGAIFVILSGFDTAGRTALTKGTSMMLVFMGMVTWTWWINRNGIPYWEMDPYPFWDARCSPDKRNRTVHILKNISIVGALTILQRVAKFEHEANPGPPSMLEGIVTSLRPWSFSSSVAPIFVLVASIRCLLGVELPGFASFFSLVLAVIAIQACGNLVNSLKDFERGIDTKENAGDRTLVDNLVSVPLLKGLAVAALVWWCSFFLWSVVASGYSGVVLGCALFGTVVAIGYTAGPAPLKYIGLGDLAIFCCFGPVLMVYCSVVLVSTVHWKAIVMTVPVSLYVVAILHANNYRDIDSDAATGAVTFAIVLGKEASKHYYSVLLTLAHGGALLAGYIFGCVGVASTLFVVPQSIWLCIRLRRPSTLSTQDEETAKTTLMFSVAMSLGIITMPGMEISPHGLGFSALVVLVLKAFAD